MQSERPIDFRGDSLHVIKGFPEPARQRLGYQLGLVQLGEMPDDYKPMTTVGSGVYEVRVAEGKRAFRCFYVTKLGDAVYVLHAFEKKTEKTSRPDIEKGRARYRALVRELQAA